MQDARTACRMPLWVYSAYMAEMKRRHSETGPVGDQVAQNLADFRRRRRMTTKRLAEEVSDLGVPMTASTVTKIETQGRRVFVDELVALAAALNVTPAALMLPGRDPRQPVWMGESMPWRRAWRWMHGAAPLPGGYEEADFGDFLGWLAVNRPYMSEAEFKREYLGPTQPATWEEFMKEEPQQGEEEDDG